MHRMHLTVLLAVIGVCVGYVLQSGASLPDTVATHFGWSGVPDGHMSRGGYLTLYVAILVGVPGVVALLPPALARGAGHGLNIPNRKYWLAPARRQATAEFLTSHGCLLGGVLALLLTSVHALIVEANGRQPIALNVSSLWPVLLLFVVATVVWVVAFQRRFRKGT
jgi:uncharacterized membrane protein